MAATDKITGKDGTFTYDTTEIVITDFSVDVESDVQDVTDSSSASTGWEENIPNGWKRWKGAASGFVLDGTDTLTVGGVAATAIFLAETGVTWTGSCIVTSNSVSLAVKGTEAVKQSFTVIGTGALTEANA